MSTRSFKMLLTNYLLIYKQDLVLDNLQRLYAIKYDQPTYKLFIYEYHNMYIYVQKDLTSKNLLDIDIPRKLCGCHNMKCTCFLK